MLLEYFYDTDLAGAIYNWVRYVGRQGNTSIRFSATIMDIGRRYTLQVVQPHRVLLKGTEWSKMCQRNALSWEDMDVSIHSIGKPHKDPFDAGNCLNPFPFCWYPQILPNYPPTQLPKTNLDKGQLGGSDVKSVDIRGQTGVSLLGAIRTAGEC
jgi:hypothetical protein